MDPVTLVLVLLAGFAASFLSGIAGGGGGMISLPALLFLGLPPATAIATGRFGGLGGGAPHVYKFSKAGKIAMEYALPLTIAGVLGTIIGTKILLDFDKTLLSKTIGILLLVMLPLIFTKPAFGMKRKKIRKNGKILGYLAYFVVEIYDGFVSIAAGILATYALIYTLGLTYLEANATDKLPALVNSVLAVGIYAYYGLVDYPAGIVLLAGMLAGGWAGAHFAIKKGNEFVKLAFSLVVVASAAKILFF